VPDDTQAWREWSAEQWNQHLLLFCFVQDAEAPPWQGIRASEDELQVLVGDNDTSPMELAMTLKLALDRQARHGADVPCAAALMALQVESFRPAPAKLPPFFAFLWFTCLVAHGFPDPQMEGKFHARFDQLFGPNQQRFLAALPQAWEKLIRWLNLDGIFGGAPHRSLQLRPIPGNCSRIGHSWTLSFPRLADRRLLLQRFHTDHLHGHRLDPWSPSLMERLLQDKGFSHDFRTALQGHVQELQTTRDQDSWFTAFLLSEIDQLLHGDERRSALPPNSIYGPLLLKSYGLAIGVVLLAEVIPPEQQQGLKRTSGTPWGIEAADLLVPTDPDDPHYAAYDAGSLAIDPLDSPIVSLRPHLERGLLLFGSDPSLDQLRLVLGVPSAPLSHALVRDAHARDFLEHWGGEPLPCDEDGWQCIRGFSASIHQLRRFPSVPAAGSRAERPHLIPVGGVRLDRSFLATGLGLPAVRIRGPHIPRAVLLLSPENRSIDYEPSSSQAGDPGPALEPDDRWAPKMRGRQIASFASGEARLVAYFQEAPSLECRLELARVEARPTFLRAHSLHCREDWGLSLGPTQLESPAPRGEPSSPSEKNERQARELLNDGRRCNPIVEEQMLEALCATFQRCQQIRRRDFEELIQRLGIMSTFWPGLLDGLLRAWVEGGWLDEGLLQRRSLWRLQPVDPRLVVLADDRLQLVGLLPSLGLVQLIAHALQLGLTVQAVPPAAPHLPRGWRFQGAGCPALAVLARLPLVERDAWVPSPCPVSWQVEANGCDGPAWAATPHEPVLRTQRIRGNRNGCHRDAGGKLSYELMASTTTAITAERGPYGRYRWHSDDQHERFTSCHRNRVALHALNGATNGYWPFGIVSSSNTILRLYDADAYLPLPIGRYAALVGEAMPGPNLPPDSTDHTYRYSFDQPTIDSFRTDRRLPVTRPSTRLTP